jgi:hypothetical protein
MDINTRVESINPSKECTLDNMYADMDVSKSKWYELFKYFDEGDYTKNQGSRLFNKFLRRNPHLISNVGNIKLEGELSFGTPERMGDCFVDTVMLACWHYLNPDNGKESDLIAAAISQGQIKLREDFDAVFGAGHGVTVKPKGSQVFNYDGATISFDKLAKDECPTKTQRILENFANSETPAL